MHTQASQQRVRLCMATAIPAAAAAAVSAPPTAACTWQQAAPLDWSTAAPLPSAAQLRFGAPAMASISTIGQPSVAMPCSMSVTILKQGLLLLSSKSLMHCICRSKVAHNKSGCSEMTMVVVHTLNAKMQLQRSTIEHVVHLLRKQGAQLQQEHLQNQQQAHPGCSGRCVLPKNVQCWAHTDTT